MTSCSTLELIDSLEKMLTKHLENETKDCENEKQGKKVMVSGCYDLLHGGHIAFFNDAAKYGKLYVRVGTDDNIRLLKNHNPLFNEQERLFIVRNIKSVFNAELCSGKGMLDFEPDLDIIKPDIFFVNEDGDRSSKREICEKRNIQYIVSKRVPPQGLPERSSTGVKEVLALKQESKTNHENEDQKKNSKKNDNVDHIKQHIEKLNKPLILSPSDVSLYSSDQQNYSFPWRLCLAGGWLDQPFVSKIYGGSVIVVNIQHNNAFKLRSGLATSTRNFGIKLWGCHPPPSGTSCVDAAKYLFGAENPPGSQYVSGSQDALGLLLPGINRLDYNGGYWPYNIVTVNTDESNIFEHIKDEHLKKTFDINKCIEWLQSVLWLVPTISRPNGYDPLKYQYLTIENIKLLAEACDIAWKAILEKDIKNLGLALTNTMIAWKKMLPETVPDELDEWWTSYKNTHYGCLYSGAGGGFLMVISDKPVKDGFQIQINSKAWIR